MPNNTGKRIKKTGEATHRRGTLRAAVKPTTQQRSTAQLVEQTITEFMARLGSGKTTQVYFGEGLANAANSLKQLYGLAAAENVYLVVDLSGKGTANPGMLLSGVGVHLKGGTGGDVLIDWDEFTKLNVGIDQGVLVLGQSGIMFDDAQVIAALLKAIQSSLA